MWFSMHWMTVSPSREVLSDHAHADLDLRDPLLRDIERIPIAQRLVDGAIPDRKHDGRDEHRDDHLDESEAARAHHCDGAPLLGGAGELPGPPV